MGSSNLPPGVNESDIPGNRPQDEVFDNWIEGDIGELLMELAELSMPDMVDCPTCIDINPAVCSRCGDSRMIGYPTFNVHDRIIEVLGHVRDRLDETATVVSTRFRSVPGEWGFEVVPMNNDHDERSIGSVGAVAGRVRPWIWKCPACKMDSAERFDDRNAAAHGLTRHRDDRGTCPLRVKARHDNQEGNQE